MAKLVAGLRRIIAGVCVLAAIIGGLIVFGVAVPLVGAPLAAALFIGPRQHASASEHGGVWFRRVVEVVSSRGPGGVAGEPDGGGHGSTSGDGGAAVT